MKKKGRISGTIGLILAVVILGGTLVYSSIFDKNTVGTANLKGVSSPLGAKAGGVFQSFKDKNGAVQSLAALAVDTNTLLVGNTTLETAFDSFSATYSSSYSVSEGKKNEEGKLVGNVVMSKIDGNIYSDKSFTYESFTLTSLNTAVVDSSKYEYQTLEVVYDKVAGCTWVKSYTDSGTPTDIAWEQSTSANSFQSYSFANTFLIAFSTTLCTAENLESFKMDYLTGYLSFKTEQTNDALTTKEVYSFMTGTRPEMNYSVSMVDTTDGKTQLGRNFSIVFSNLNQTKVNISTSLKNAMEGK